MAVLSRTHARAHACVYTQGSYPLASITQETMIPNILPAPTLVAVWARDVWYPPTNRDTLAGLNAQDSAAVWCGINYKLTYEMYMKQHRFFNSMVLVWQPEYSPAVATVENFHPDYRDACSHMMYHMGLMQATLTNPYALADYPHGDPFNPESSEFGVITGKSRLRAITDTAQLIIKLNTDAVDVISSDAAQGCRVLVELKWSSAACAEYSATSAEP